MPTTTAQLAAFLADGGTVTFAYPSGTSAASFPTTSGHVLRDRGTKWFSPGEFTVTFGVSNITVTYNGGETIPKGTTLTLDLDAVEDVGDALKIDLGDGAGAVALDDILLAMGGNTLGVRQFLGSDGTIQAEIGAVANAVNRVRLQAGLSGQGPSVSAQGGGTNVELNYAGKGTGGHVFGNSAGSLFAIADAGDALPTVNILTVKPGSTGVNPTLESNRGTIYAAAASQSHVFRVNGEPCFVVARSGTGAINYFQAEGSSTFARLVAQGTDTNILAYFAAKGSSPLLFANGSGTVLALDTLSSSSSRPNYWIMRNAAAGNAPAITVASTGSVDANINLQFTPLGTGRTIFGGSTGIRLPSAASDPTGAANGDMYYNTATHKFKGYANGSWVDLH